MTTATQTRDLLATQGLGLVTFQRAVDGFTGKFDVLDGLGDVMVKLAEANIDQAARDHVAVLDAEAGV